jgi:hypothetical protein
MVKTHFMDKKFQQEKMNKKLNWSLKYAPFCRFHETT